MRSRDRTRSRRREEPPRRRAGPRSPGPHPVRRRPSFVTSRYPRQCDRAPSDRGRACPHHSRGQACEVPGEARARERDRGERASSCRGSAHVPTRRTPPPDRPMRPEDRPIPYALSGTALSAAPCPDFMAGSALESASNRSRGRHTRGTRAFPEALPAHHAARQHPADDHRVATGGAEEPPAGGYPGRPELHVIPLVISPPNGLGSVPRLVHLNPLNRCELPAPAPCRSKVQRCQLAPEPCPAANPQALLQRLVLLSILDRGPHEQPEDQEDRRYSDDREDDLLSGVHGGSLGRSLRLGLRSSGCVDGRAGVRLLSGPKKRASDDRRRSCEESPDEEGGVVAAVERGERAVG